MYDGSECPINPIPMVVCNSKEVFTGLWSLLVTASQLSNDNNCKFSISDEWQWR